MFRWYLIDPTGRPIEPVEEGFARAAELTGSEAPQVDTLWSDIADPDSSVDLIFDPDANAQPSFRLYLQHAGKGIERTIAGPAVLVACGAVPDGLAHQLAVQDAVASAVEFPASGHTDLAAWLKSRTPARRDRRYGSSSEARTRPFRFRGSTAKQNRVGCCTSIQYFDSCPMSALPKHIEELHPSLWRGNQLARWVGHVVPTGHERLSQELPGRGWPVSALTELLLQQAGTGELRLLQPALAAVAKRPIVLIKPPHTPDSTGLSYIGVPVDKVMRLEPQNTSDALWSTEQILKANTCGAVLLWQSHMRPDSLRRLSLHAQSCETLFFILRPLVTQQDASPATLRLALRAAAIGVNIEIIKRKGPLGVEPFELALAPSPVLVSPHGRAPRPLRKIVGVPMPEHATTE